MARALRLSFENAYYHITSRGIRRENIFRGLKDKEVFLEKMNEAFEKYSIVCYAYCLMDNHYHLFIKTPFANISEVMHYLNTSYANWFRTKYKIVGPIFQGRYKSILVDGDIYALVLTTYIHLNPLRAGIIERIEDYPYSSYPYYVEPKKSIINNLDTLLILNHFSNNLKEAQEKYREYVFKNIDLKNPLKESYKNIILGDERFIEKVKQKITKSKELKDTREISHIKTILSYNVDDILKTISEYFKIEEKEIFKKKKGNIYRNIGIYLLKRYSSLSLNQIGELFGIDYTSVSQTAKRFEKRLKEDNALSKMIKEVTKVWE